MDRRQALQAQLALAASKNRARRHEFRKIKAALDAQRRRPELIYATDANIKLLALAAVHAEGHEQIPSLIAVLLRLVTVAEAKAIAWVSERPSALQASRQKIAKECAFVAARAAVVSSLAARAQKLVAEARVAIWVRQMNHRGVAPMREHMINQLIAHWPGSTSGFVVDRTFLVNLQRSSMAKKRWASRFRSRWAMKYQALPTRAYLEPDVRRCRAPRPQLRV